MHADGVSPVTELTIRALKETRAARDLGALLTTWRRPLRQLFLDPDSLDALRQIFSYLLSVRGRRDLETLDLQALDIDGESKATMTTMAGALIQQGLEQGLQQGLQQGRQEGFQAGYEAARQQLVKRPPAHEFFLRLLTRKFPRTPAALLATIPTADDATLTRWGEQLLTATTLEDVFADPPG